MDRIPDKMKGELAAKGLERSGITDLYLIDEVDGAGFELAVRALSRDEAKAWINGHASAKDVERRNATTIAACKAVLWPDRGRYVAAAEHLGGMHRAVSSMFERLGGMYEPSEQWVTITDAKEAAETLGRPVAELEELRKRYHHQGQLAGLRYIDADLSRDFSIVVRRPGSGDEASFASELNGDDAYADAARSFALRCVVSSRGEAEAVFDSMPLLAPLLVVPELRRMANDGRNRRQVKVYRRPERSGT